MRGSSMGDPVSRDIDRSLHREGSRLARNADRAVRILRRRPRPAHHFGEHQSIAWALAERPNAIFVAIAAVLGVSVDETLGVVKSRSAVDSTPRSAAELRLWRRLQQIQRLPAHKRKAVIQVLDGFLAGTEESG